jgi:hypothetical protein
VSHFTVLCILEIGENVEGDLVTLLAPYDENLEVEPYRKRLPDNELERARAFYDEHPEHRGDLPADATDVQVLSDYNGGTVFAYEDGSGFYQMSTYNPESKWDWWQIGGRWGGYFPIKSHHPSLIAGHMGWNQTQSTAGKADGGIKAALDLDGMRAAAGDEARKTWATFQEAVAGTPTCKRWSEFIAEVEAKTLTIEQARDEYHAQPRVAAFRAPAYRATFGPFSSLEDYDMSESQFVARAVAASVPGYAVLSAKEGWLAKGEMGWFGMGADDHSSEAGYWEHVNGLIDGLPDEAFLVVVDCHI